MSLSLINEQKRRQSMARCFKSAACRAAFCPLDPYLKLKLPISGRPLCFWILRYLTVEDDERIPDFIRERLPRYHAFVFRTGPLVAHRLKTSR